jgi:hypothetical protein
VIVNRSNLNHYSIVLDKKQDKKAAVKKAAF